MVDHRSDTDCGPVGFRRCRLLAVDLLSGRFDGQSRRAWSSEDCEDGSLLLEE